MKRFAFVAVVVLSLVSVLFQSALARNLAVEQTQGELFTSTESQVLADRYKEAIRTDDVQLKRSISEEIGERGAEKFARNKGWNPVLTKADKSVGHPQGFDQVWKGNDGTIHVIEAKGGESYLATGNGSTQGTTEWCVKAAEKTLKNHAATETEKVVARQVLQAASEGKLDIYVIQTSHTLGRPSTTVCREIGECTSEARHLARTITRGVEEVAHSTTVTTAPEPWTYKPVVEPELPRVPEYTVSSSMGTAVKTATKATRVADNTAVKAAEGASSVLPTVAKTVAVAGAVVDVGFRAKDAYDVEQDYKNGRIDNHERVVSHVKNGAGMAGGWGGAAAGGYAGATGGAMAGAAVGSVVPVVGTAIGGAVGSAIGGLGGAIGGYFFGEKAAEAGVDCVDGWVSP